MPVAATQAAHFAATMIMAITPQQRGYHDHPFKPLWCKCDHALTCELLTTQTFPLFLTLTKKPTSMGMDFSRRDRILSFRPEFDRVQCLEAKYKIAPWLRMNCAFLPKLLT